MSITAATLRDQLAKLEEEFKQSEAASYRLDGAIQLIKYLISEAEKPDPTPTE